MSQKSVTMTALISRINRKLKPDHETLKVTRGERLRRYVPGLHRMWRTTFL